MLRQCADRGMTPGVDPQAALETLVEAEPVALMRTLGRYPEVLASAARALEPHQLATYLRDLATQLHAFYNTHTFLVDDDAVRVAGEPDLIVKLPEVLVKGDDPDWWGDIEPIPTGLAEDRYVKSVEIREVNDVGRNEEGGHEGRHTVGGRFVVHHMIWSTRVPEGEAGDGPSSTSWPVHEVGREPDLFDEDAGRLLRAGSSVVSNSLHLHSNGRDTRAHLEIGFRFHPPDYMPKYRRAFFGLGNASDIDIRAGRVRPGTPRLSGPQPAHQDRHL